LSALLAPRILTPVTPSLSHLVAYAFFQICLPICYLCDSCDSCNPCEICDTCNPCEICDSCLSASAHLRFLRYLQPLRNLRFMLYLSISASLIICEFVPLLRFLLCISAYIYPFRALTAFATNRATKFMFESFYSSVSSLLCQSGNSSSKFCVHLCRAVD